MIRNKARGGFTLVELMMVVLIISLLIFILIPAVTGVVKQVDIHQTQMLVNLLDLGCHQYQAAFGSYPPNSIEYMGHLNPGGNTDGWYWLGNSSTPSTTGDPTDQRQSIFILTYCLQGPAGMGWKMNRDGKLGPPKNNPSASVTADFGPWVEAGNQSIQTYESFTSSPVCYRPVFVDSFGTPICYFAAVMNKTIPRLTAPSNALIPTGEGLGNYDRYQPWEVRTIWPGTHTVLSYPGGGIVNSAGVQGFGSENYYAIHFYAAMMNQTYNPSNNLWYGSSGITAGGTSNGQVYHPTSFVVWSAGPDQFFGFWYWDDTWNGVVMDLTFNPANFDDITNFR
jgi:prepilin-type N-terminal cleavage/methylation domain-containing protein